MVKKVYTKSKKYNTIQNNTWTPHATKGDLDLFLEHLVTASAADFVPDAMSETTPFVPLDSASPAQTLNAQYKTSNWLKDLVGDDDEILSKAQEEKAAEAFNALTRQDPSSKQKLLQLDLPEEIKSAVGMVTAYQWKFVEQAEELRSMSVAKIVKETDHPDAKVRLKALELLGKVTEVALFTERVQIKNEDVSDEELDARIKEKLGKYMGAVDVVDIEEIDVKIKVVGEKSEEAPETPKENEWTSIS